MSEDKIPKTLQGQAFERAKNPTKLNAGTPHDWEDLYQNTKHWQDSSDGWVKTMTQSKENKEIFEDSVENEIDDESDFTSESKENKELYQEYIKTTDTPVAYRDWLREKVNGTTTSSTKTSK